MHLGLALSSWTGWTVLELRMTSCSAVPGIHLGCRLCATTLKMLVSAAKVIYAISVYRKYITTLNDKYSHLHFKFSIEAMKVHGNLKDVYGVNHYADTNQLSMHS